MRRACEIAGLAALLVSCHEEQRALEVSPAAASVEQTAPAMEFQSGARFPSLMAENPLEKNQLAISEGKRLFSNFNCSGCHSRGGGGMGPPLIDSHWIYGAEPQNIFETIAYGRPNGMPSFGGKIPRYQIWQLMAYLDSIRLDPPSSGGK